MLVVDERCRYIIGLYNRKNASIYVFVRLYVCAYIHLQIFIMNKSVNVILIKCLKNKNFKEQNNGNKFRI